MRIRVDKKVQMEGVLLEKDRLDQLKRADLMLKYFKQAAPGTYPVAPSQVGLIKTWWWELHNYTGAEFTFNESYTKIKKL